MSNIKNINAQQLKDWLAAGDTVLIDVREPSEFTEWRIPQAISMPLTNIEAHLPNLEGEKRKVVFQCLKGKRGEMGANAAVEKFGASLEVYNLDGGIEAWNAAGFAITRDAANDDAAQCGKCLPIARQVQVAAGGLIIFFSLLALAGSTIGAIMTVLIGGGLLFAGFTGSCMLASLLMKMPWNKKGK